MPEPDPLPAGAAAAVLDPPDAPSDVQLFTAMLNRTQQSYSFSKPTSGGTHIALSSMPLRQRPNRSYNSVSVVFRFGTDGTLCEICAGPET